MAFTGQYSPEAIQEFKKKDLQTRKAGVIITFYGAHKRLPNDEEMQEWLDLVYKITEKDKVLINPEYIPNTKEGQPFESKPHSWENKDKPKDGKVDKKDLDDHD